MPKPELFDLSCKLLHETRAAWRIDDGKKTDWFPKSQCELAQESDGTWTLTAPIWLLKEKGFI